MSWPVTTARSLDGVLEIGGVSIIRLVERYGTPLYVFHEETLRQRARSIRDVFLRSFERSKIMYAGKAYLSPALMRILTEEGLGLDVVSGGEIFAGLRAGVDPSDMVFHGNNKSRGELAEAVASGIGLIAVDNDLEIDLLDDVARELGRDVRVVLRLNPGLDPHTHQKMRTGAADSKFGFPVADGQARTAVDRIVASQRLRLVGYHAHVGSQIFDPSMVGQTIDELLSFAADSCHRHGVVPEVIIPGGGFGMADDASGEDVSIEVWARLAADATRCGCRRHGFALPVLMVEPGRAIIGPAGVALYEVGSRKFINGDRTYVSVDGGMADNIRPALYGARYTASLANRDPQPRLLESVTIAGKYCESGDVLIEEIELPRLDSGDLLAIPMVGAYCLAMASNYNLAPRPAVVLVNSGQARVVRRRESYEDMLQNDV
ncbi:MAG: diaminopimelate decarboxylase [Chloroflexia bacterium]|nr:diaminopimelate decarboxylase [Chloroflexia bacterium]